MGGLNPEVAHETMAGLSFYHGVAQALEAGKLFHIDLNAQELGRYDQDFRFGSEDIKDAFFLVKLLEESGYDGPRHFDAHAYRAEDSDGVRDFARGCMRTLPDPEPRRPGVRGLPRRSPRRSPRRRCPTSPSRAPALLGDRPRRSSEERVPSTPSPSAATERPPRPTGGRTAARVSTGVRAHGDIRRVNLALVLGRLLAEGPQSRAAIAGRTGLMRSTVSSLVSELEGLGLVASAGRAPAGWAGRAS